MTLKAKRDYRIPVKKKVVPGIYKKAFARSLTPDSNGKISICYPSGKKSKWDSITTLYEKRGFNRREDSIILLQDNGNIN